MTTTEVLIAAREKVKLGWCQGTDARNERGHRVYALDPLACAWCMSGAIYKIIATDDGGHLLDRATLKVLADAGTPSVVVFNDAPGRTQAEVIAAFDKAIELSKQTI